MTYTWDDVCSTKDCTHDNPECGAWEELQALEAERIAAEWECD
ncbi:hypothetical protein BKA00_007452 [Actinomadura coerulea]|uniref:Uncharacterized protein n=1 Tax=Actinomadura coerulea TaxID=46159 RepID=A0A7X0G6U1_9ACTN|nr:hypothetical protein [Actinomadura coerulea]MBB6400538.1 hypothetical protein [Actinomadura coerulea]GGQ07950.1 hypothetical protein GCM10010187_25060 [Actinomadura coerulea]